MTDGRGCSPVLLSRLPYSALLKTRLYRTLPLVVVVLLQSIYGHHRIDNVPPSTTFHRPVSSLTDYGVAAHFLSIPPTPPQEASFLHVVRKWLARRHMNKTSDGPNVCRFNFTSSSTPGHIHDVLNIYYRDTIYRICPGETSETKYSSSIHLPSCVHRQVTGASVDVSVCISPDKSLKSENSCLCINFQ